MKEILGIGASKKIFANGIILVAQDGQLIPELTSAWWGTKREAYWDIASIQKGLVTMAIVQAILDGKADHSNKVAEYLPLSGEYSQDLTIKHLMEYSCDFNVGAWNYTLDDLCKSGLRFKPGGRYAYRNSQHIILAEILKRLYPSVSLSQALKSALGDKLDFSGFSFNPIADGVDKGYIVPSTPYLHGLCHDPLARCHITEGKGNELGHAGAFAKVDFLLEFGKIFWQEPVGKCYKDAIGRNGYLANKKSGLIFSYGAARRNKSFTGHRDFDSKHFSFMAFTGPALYCWPEEKLEVLILINSTYYPDGYQKRSREVLEFRKKVLSSVLEHIWGKKRRGWAATKSRLFLC